MEISNLPLLCITMIVAKEATKTQTKHVDRMIPHKNTHKGTLEYAGVRKQITEKVWFHHHLSFSYQTLD